MKSELEETLKMFKVDKKQIFIIKMICKTNKNCENLFLSAINSAQSEYNAIKEEHNREPTEEEIKGIAEKIKNDIKFF